MVSIVFPIRRNVPPENARVLKMTTSAKLTRMLNQKMNQQKKKKKGFELGIDSFWAQRAPGEHHRRN
jgi:hypothetical protein